MNKFKSWKTKRVLHKMLKSCDDMIGESNELGFSAEDIKDLQDWRDWCKNTLYYDERKKELNELEK